MAEAPEIPSVESMATLPETVKKGLSASVKYLVGNFIEEKHYSKISSSLASRWNTSQSMNAAMKLMEQSGVHITPEEEQRLSGLTEAQMIESLVSKMPQQSKEQFQHFFLQLQLIVSTATRVRQALEAGRADLVEQAMDDAESTGIVQYILKLTIVQAGSEVTNLKKTHAAFVKDAEGKLARMVKASEDAQVAKERLQKAMGELAVFQSTANENIKKVLMAFAGGSRTALLHGVVSTWHNYCKKMKVENEIFEEYREELEDAERRLIDAKSEQLKSITGMINRRHAGGKVSLTQEVFDLWKNDVAEAKDLIASKGAIAELEAKLGNMNAQASANAKKVLARCGAASVEQMRDMCFVEWRSYHAWYQKHLLEEEAVKAEEQRIQEFMKSHSENAKGLLSNMSAATDSGLLHEVLVAWNEVYKEEKQINEYAQVMQQTQGRFGQFGDRNKKGAASVMGRAEEHANCMLYLKVFGAWRLDTRIEQLLKVHQGKIDSKRSQLAGVQKKFREFAVQLENNINAGADSDRAIGGAEYLAKQPESCKGRKLRNSVVTTAPLKEGQISLPVINQKRPGSSENKSDRKQAWS